MKTVRVWESQVVIPTYEAGIPEKNPMFLEKRVYQGSTGKVYPYPITETIKDKRVDKTYTVVYLENEYLKVSVLPELGGRIQRAIDKTNGYDFVYYNQVIKPALVGLLGPWVSGGIEFNWPQHHRPSTFMPVDYLIQEDEDGSGSVLLHDVDRMNGTKSTLKISLHPDKAYIELSSDLYNRTALPQSFLWWANPAVPANEHTQSIFPPDVRFVMDHGKRDVSRFPISRSTYYKKDYSEGVDISFYKNIPVPTSYMVEHSDYDFIGNYDHKEKAGLLHVASHHVSPGKKQWTWGHGDFGQAWDRNLTDEDGPYIELMTGIYTDNQPDFTWLKPFETKQFKQYFMPYKDVGVIHNASVDAAIGIELDDACESLVLKAYASSVFDEATLLVTEGETVIYKDEFSFSPKKTYKQRLLAEDLNLEQFNLDQMSFEIQSQGRTLVSYTPEEESIKAMPDAAKEPLPPEEVMHNEELLLIGQHLEQIRHARTRPDQYYLEGLKRDPQDSRLNTAYGTLLLRRGHFKRAQSYFEQAIERLITWNFNPYNSEAYEMLGLSLWYQGSYDEAFDAFHKAIWSKEQQATSFYYLAAISARRGAYKEALDFVNSSLNRQMDSIKARGLKAYLLRKLGLIDEAKHFVIESLKLDPFDFLSYYEGHLLDQEMDNEALTLLMRDDDQRILMVARDYHDFGAYQEAVDFLGFSTARMPLVYYYQAYYKSLLGLDAAKELKLAEASDPAYCFPNALEDIPVLSYAIESSSGPKAKYYLANLFYDRLRFDEAKALWLASHEEDPTFPTVARNLSLVYANKEQNFDLAKQYIEEAFLLDTSDARVFMEKDQLYRRMGISFKERLSKMQEHPELLTKLDPLYVEYITLLNLNHRYEDAYRAIEGHRFHPWEGGEGKITAQYEWALIKFAEEAVSKNELAHAERLLSQALVYPENLGEGKLEGTKDNHLHFRLARLYQVMGEDDKSIEHYRLATRGVSELSGAMYYNDQPVDMILYQGLSWQALGEERAAKACFSRLIDAGEEHLDDEVKADFFAVSLPEMTVYEEDEAAVNQANCYYLMALGNIGLEEYKKAVSFLKQALTKDPSHMKAVQYVEEINNGFFS